MFINPVSGAGLAVKTGNWLNTQLSSRGIDHHLFATGWPENLDACLEAWIVGGDGTANYFINKYRNQLDIPLVLFKGGTGNDIAWRLYGNIGRDELLHKALTARPQKVDAAECNGQLFVNSSGIGFDGEVVRSGKTIRRIGGHLGYLLVVLRKILSFREPIFGIATETAGYSEKFLLVAVNNSSRTGGGFLVTPNASITDGRLDMLLCKPLGFWKRLRYLPVIEKGKHLQLPFIIHSLEKEVTVTASRELYAHLDGELIYAKRFHFKVLPGALTIKW
nr:diacylglycerol kinase family protein [Ferruginibacter sp. HRS2-29]